MNPLRVLACVVFTLAGASRLCVAQYHVYWGDTHGHTSLSDGKGTLDDYFRYAREKAGLDWVIVSDHDFGHGPPWRMPQGDWELIQRKADQHTVAGRFVAISGYEWTSQVKYWTPAEPLFSGPVRRFGHKVVYFPGRVDGIFSAKDARYNSPDLLARAVLKAGGLIQTAHPDAGPDGKEQFDYDAAWYPVIPNTEMAPDSLLYDGKKYEVRVESTVRDFLGRGGRTGFVAGTDTHEGKPAARTAILARELTRPVLFDALRHRRNYAITNARILLDFTINGRVMGEEIEISGRPRIAVTIKGTDRITEAVIVRDGVVVHSRKSDGAALQFELVDDTFPGNSYYYLRVTQADVDEHGNPSRAWSSPIWVRTGRPGAFRPE